MIGGVWVGLARYLDIKPIYLLLLTVISLYSFLSSSKRRLIVGLSGMIGLVTGAIARFFIANTSTGNVFIPILGIIGPTISVVLGKIVADTRQK